MSIRLEFINFIVPIATIKNKYPGGWEQCLKDHETLIGGRVWYDEHLFRDGAMNPMDIGRLLEKWKNLGFHTHNGGDNHSEWIDVCVLEGMFCGDTLACKWLEIDADGNTAFLKDAPKGEAIGREEMIE